MWKLLCSEAENLATAKIRANRVKSELIIRAEIKEENFITRNHATEGDFVTVLVTVTHTVGFHICLGYYVQTVLVSLLDTGEQSQSYYAETDYTGKPEQLPCQFIVVS